MSHITREQRYTISAMHKQGCSQKFIAETIGKDKSVISRELKRNSTKNGKYHFCIAQELAEIRKERFVKPRKLNTVLKKEVVSLLKKHWSPEQIEGRFRLDNKLIVSHETIYKLVRKDKEDGGDLYLNLRHKLKHRKRPVGICPAIINRISIDERPDVINNKERFGDWEIDTIIGADGKGAIVTIVERTTAFMMLEKLKYGKTAKELSKVVIRMLMSYRKSVLSITGDNGSEFADHETIAKELATKFYFTHPYSSWEKGLIENTNKLIRQYIPKKSNFNDYTEQQIKEIQYTINSRPRKKLNYYTPKEKFFLFLQNNRVAFAC